ncbi:MAG TPA: lipocalin-like domain-containing protein [Roseiarcus sp.]|nr:lipocalin-like domain-containing protein [Roseiarcus sp.]
MTNTSPAQLTRDAILGSWRMTSWTYEVVETGVKQDALGPQPNGWIVYTPERVMVLVLKANRNRPAGLIPTPEEKLALYDTMFAYSGTYTVHPDRVIHHLDMSWNEAWSGTEQVRFCKLDGNNLIYTSAPAKNPLDGREATHEVTFERASS